jgi:DNA primase
LREARLALIDLRRARTEVRLSEVLELLGWQPRVRVDVQVRGSCPVHGSQRPTSRTFSAHLQRGLWHCFRCGASGNTLDLWAQVTGQGIYEAVLDLYRRLGRAVPWLPPTTSPKEKGSMNDP